MKTDRKVKSNEILFKSVLARLTKDRRLTASQVAALAGVARSVVADWLSGSNLRDLAAVGKLAKALGVSMRALLLDEEEEQKITQTAVGSASDIVSIAFDEIDLFDGLCRVSIRKVVPRKVTKLI
jgi:transcriptional regulator with XRE-family HTH domain